jgi:hypothetical protein
MHWYVLDYRTLTRTQNQVTIIASSPEAAVRTLQKVCAKDQLIDVIVTEIPENGSVTK